MKVDWQISQSYVTPSWTESLWNLRPDKVLYSLSQELHWYFFPLCFAWICSLRLLLWDALYPHIVHGYSDFGFDDGNTDGQSWLFSHYCDWKTWIWIENGLKMIGTLEI